MHLRAYRNSWCKRHLFATYRADYPAQVFEIIEEK